MPQSRQRKIPKGKKRSKGLYPASKSKPPTGRNRQARIIAIVIVVVLAGSAIGYLIAKRSSNNVGTEVTTASGLKYVDVTEGTGPTPRAGQQLAVHYRGTLQDGREFDSSYNRGTPYVFRIGTGTVIKGWDEGLMTMKAGGKRKLIVPPSLGYGPRGNPPNIPGNSTLLFDVELVSIK